MFSVIFAAWREISAFYEAEIYEVKNGRTYCNTSLVVCFADHSNMRRCSGQSSDSQHPLVYPAQDKSCH